MTRALFDVNIVLDVLLDRAPFAEASSALWSLVEQDAVKGFLPAHAVTTVHYLNTRAVGRRHAANTTESLLSVFEVALVDRRVFEDALTLGWTDFEDAVTAAAARRARCDVIVTRNPKDFPRCPVRVVTPVEAVAWLEATRS